MWVYLEADSATCNTETFGQGDPAGGYSKWCRCVGGEPTLRPSTQAPSHVPTILAPTASAPPTVSPPPSGLPTTAAPSAFSFWDCDSDPNCCAEQGGSCACDGDWASYGTNGNSWAGAPDPMWTTMHILDLKDADGAVECSTDFFGRRPGGATRSGEPRRRVLSSDVGGDARRAQVPLRGRPADGAAGAGLLLPLLRGRRRRVHGHRRARAAPTFAYSADDCTAAQGYALDIVTRTCKPDVAVKDAAAATRGPTATRTTRARFCDSMTCIPQGFEQECTGAARRPEFRETPTERPLLRRLYRSDMWDTSNSVVGQSDQYADLAQTTREYYGLTMYTRILRVMEKDIGEPVSSTASDMAQFGYLGQWVAPLARTKFDIAGGSHATAMASIEGGVYNNNNLGYSRLPKYLAGGSLYAYTPVSDVGRGWGFQEMGIACKRGSGDEHEDDGGVFLGAGWVVLPIFPGGKIRNRTTLFGNEDFGLTTWTHVIDTAQFSGPLLAYAPQFWMRRLEEWCNQNEAYYAGEYDSLPRRHLPARVFAYAGESDDELEALFANFDTRFNGSYHMNTYGAYFDLGLTSLVYEDAMYIDIENGVSSDEYYEDVGTGDDLDPVETNIFYEWEGAEDRLWTRYYKATYTPGRKARANQPGENQTYYAAEPIDESEAPESLRDAEYTLPLWGRANYANHAAPGERDLRLRRHDKQTRLERDGSLVLEILASMQKRVELMHEYWQEKDFIKKATKVNHKVELDYRMIIDIPDNIPDYGWVPISLRGDLRGQHRLRTRELGRLPTQHLVIARDDDVAAVRVLSSRAFLYASHDDGPHRRWRSARFRSRTVAVLADAGVDAHALVAAGVAATQWSEARFP
ncbi:hypothetical protein SO694_0008717 [Aureococcus anophagefferens]|uniref:Uncharacterized protein n=1 Tax=Aureococcus anophagefferens TaxID=44056 RepID=A0ABR1G418_AURAN